MSFFRYNPVEGRVPPVAGGSLDGAHATPYVHREPGAYLPHPRARTAVNVALATGQPLLITGEPGVGKTALAASVADELGLRLYIYVVRSESRASDALYHFDHLRRLYDTQRDDPRARDPRNYLSFRALGTALQDPKALVLIDEIDKAPRDFPNDLLWAVERRQFDITELGETVTGTRPVIFVTSNEERDLPEPFLRRCVYLRIPFPGAPDLEKILRARLVDLPPDDPLPRDASEALVALRTAHEDRWRKAPSTSELLAWVRALRAAEIRLTRGTGALLPWAELLPEAILKTRADWELVMPPGRITAANGTR